VAVRGGAVRADAGAAAQAEDVLLVLLPVLVRRAPHEEALLHQSAQLGDGGVGLGYGGVGLGDGGVAGAQLGDGSVGPRGRRRWAQGMA
jgi:hypothetical protein